MSFSSRSMPDNLRTCRPAKFDQKEEELTKSLSPLRVVPLMDSMMATVVNETASPNLENATKRPEIMAQTMT